MDNILDQNPKCLASHSPTLEYSAEVRRSEPTLGSRAVKVELDM